MSAPRIVTVYTRDEGYVRVPEPAWCTGHDNDRPEARVDFNHSGPEQPVGPADDPVFVAMLTQHPFSSGTRDVGLFVEQTGIACTLDPDEVDKLADDLVTAAGQLRHLARELTVLRATQDGAQ